MRIVNFFKSLAVVVLAATTFVACNKTEVDTPAPEKKYNFVLESLAVMEFPAEGGEGVITWSLKEDTRVADTAVPMFATAAEWIALDADNLGKFVFFPVDFNLETSACANATHLTLLPCIGQCWQQVDESHVALHEHLGNSGSATKVSVNLEWSVGIPQVVQSTVFQQVAKEGICVVAVMQACPLVEFPSHAPAGSAIATVNKNNL